MAKGQYIGVGGVAKKVKKKYIGVGGVAHDVKSGYIGVGGVAKQYWSAGELVDFTEKLTSNGTWTAPEGCTSVTAFLVGGGGGGYCGNYDEYEATCYGGGGGGYVTTATIAVTEGQSFSVTIGGGGNGATYNTSSPSTSDSASRGGTTKFGTYSAAGGYGGQYKSIDNHWGVKGGDGGSGGAAANGAGALNINGGTNGGDGKTYYNEDYYETVEAGKGSGKSTTFDGVRYADGGCARYTNTPRTANSGNGGNGVYFSSYSSDADSRAAAKGCDGVVILKYKAYKEI